MRKIWPVILLLFLGPLFTRSVLAQDRSEANRYTDSLEAQVKTAIADTAKAEILNKLTVYWSPKDFNKAISYAYRSLKISDGNVYYTALGNFYLGVAYYLKTPAKAKKRFQRTIHLLAKDSSKRALSLKGKAWKNYGAADQKLTGDNKTLMKVLLKHSIPLAKKAGDEITEAEDLAALAMIYSNLLNYGKAITYYKKAIEIGKDALQEKPMILTKFYIRLAQNYLEAKKFKHVRLYLDSAEAFLKHRPHSIFQAIYFKTLGMYYAHTHHLKQGLANLDTALALVRQLKLPYMAGSIIFEKFRMFKTARQYDKAKKMLLKVLQNTSMISKPRNRLRIFKNLSETEAQLGHSKAAYNWLKQYATLADSLHKSAVKSKIAALEVKYKTEKKQRKILALKNKNKKQQLILQEEKTQNIFLIAGALLLLLTCVIFLILYRNKKKAALQESRLYKQRLEQERQQNQLKVYNAMIKGEEQERQRMARDLHDGLGGLLSGVKLKLSDIADKNKQDMELFRVIDQLDGSVEELRRIARNMMPETLLRYGVGTALDDLCESLQTKQVSIDFQAYQLDNDLPKTVQISLYRIVQELIANAVRHGYATNILVQVSQNEGRIFITVEDDGMGFDPNNLKKNKGIGFSNIQNRINFLNGSIDIDSTPKEGTTVNIEVNSHE